MSKSGLQLPDAPAILGWLCVITVPSMFLGLILAAEDLFLAAILRDVPLLALLAPLCIGLAWIFYRGMVDLIAFDKGDHMVRSRKRNQSRIRFCLGCEYPLFGLQTYRCPECGRQFDPQDGRTFTQFTKGQRFFKRLEQYVPPALILLGIVNLIACPMLGIDLVVGAIGFVCVCYGISLIPPPDLTTLWPKE